MVIWEMSVCVSYHADISYLFFLFHLIIIVICRLKGDREGWRQGKGEKMWKREGGGIEEGNGRDRGCREEVSWYERREGRRGVWKEKGRIKCRGQ